jgi:hypothetical protein
MSLERLRKEIKYQIFVNKAQVLLATKPSSKLTGKYAMV